MARFRYTICAYYPNLYRPAEHYPFAVLVAREKEILLAGTNLNTYRMHSEDAIEKSVLHNSVDSLERLLDSVLESSDCATGLEALNRVVSGNQSSIQFLPFQDVEAHSIHDVAFQVFADQILPRISAQTPRKGRWRAKPRMDTRELALAGQ